MEYPQTDFRNRRQNREELRSQDLVSGMSTTVRTEFIALVELKHHTHVQDVAETAIHVNVLAFAYEHSISHVVSSTALRLPLGAASVGCSVRLLRLLLTR